MIGQPVFAKRVILPTPYSSPIKSVWNDAIHCFSAIVLRCKKLEAALSLASPTSLKRGGPTFATGRAKIDDVGDVDQTDGSAGFVDHGNLAQISTGQGFNDDRHAGAAGDGDRIGRHQVRNRTIKQLFLLSFKHPGKIAISKQSCQDPVVVDDQYDADASITPSVANVNVADGFRLHCDSATGQRTHQFVNDRQLSSQTSAGVEFGEIDVSKRLHAGNDQGEGVTHRQHDRRARGRCESEVACLDRSFHNRGQYPIVLPG